MSIFDLAIFDVAVVDIIAADVAPATCWYNAVALMRPIVVILALAILFAVRAPASAQDPPPPIPRLVVDLHVVVPKFPNLPAIALSRALNQAELPGLGLGGDLAAHLYPFTWHGVTIGIGGRLTTARAHRTPAEQQQQTTLRPVTARFAYLGPQISLNFGTGTGWSYLSGGIATSTWSIVPDGMDRLPPDEERLKTLDYGGGARWFIKPHLAFSFDVRFYAINPSTPAGDLPGGPRTTLLMIGAGISLQ
jgi:hypothetical protein